MLRTTLVDKTGHYDLYAYTSGLAFLVLLSTAGVTVLSALIFLLLRDYAANVDPSPSSPSTSPSPTPADLWWHSLVTGASSACWTASYCLWCHGVRALQSQGLAAALLLLGSSLAATALYALLVATAGFLAAYVLVRRLSRIHG
ncbi:hypothetical protein KEM52_003858 [Ascosphaera acerosa]|nr:hypothetical protein KEM52_003858 [Ascosphaera acerosa]